MKIDKTKNYYGVLNLKNNCDKKDLKKSYYKLSFEFHPDKNKGKDAEIKFAELSEAYNILSDDKLREEYDKKSKFGRHYDESYELYDTVFDYSWEKHKSNLDNFKRNEINDIFLDVDVDKFDGTIEYERWVVCKKCDGTGKDLDAKIHIKDDSGNIIKTFEASDGCDFCEGTGVDYRGNKCSFCMGKGKVGMTPCDKCKGEKRIYIKQKASKIKLKGDKTQLKMMGNYSKDGKLGDLFLITRPQK